MAVALWEKTQCTHLLVEIADEQYARWLGAAGYAYAKGAGTEIEAAETGEATRGRHAVVGSGEGRWQAVHRCERRGQDARCACNGLYFRKFRDVIMTLHCVFVYACFSLILIALLWVCHRRYYCGVYELSWVLRARTASKVAMALIECKWLCRPSHRLLKNSSVSWFI